MEDDEEEGVEEEKDESEVIENEEAMEQNGKYTLTITEIAEAIFTTSFHENQENSSTELADAI